MNVDLYRKEYADAVFLLFSRQYCVDNRIRYANIPILCILSWQNGSTVFAGIHIENIENIKKADVLRKSLQTVNYNTSF